MINELDEREIVLNNYEEFIGTLKEIDVSEIDILLIFNNNHYSILPFNNEFEMFCKNNINNKIGIIHIDGIYKFRSIKSLVINRKDQPVTFTKNTCKQLEDIDKRYKETSREIDEFIYSLHSDIGS